VARGKRTHPGRGWVRALAGVSVALLFGCDAGGGTPAHLKGPPAQILILNGSVLRAVVASDGQLSRTFASRRTYVAGPTRSRPPVPSVPGIVEPTAIYKSYAAFAQDLAAGLLPKTVHTVLYDPEKWPGTPLAEQRDPRAYMLRFSLLARAHGLVPILAPARDLVLVPGAACPKRRGENLTRAYLRCGLATADAHAAVLVVQSQLDELSVPVFRHFLAVASRQARAGNPHVAVVAQLATAPDGQAATAEQLVAAARSVSGMVQGFSLNARLADLETAASVLGSFRPS
jgi:hypothetical protein